MISGSDLTKFAAQAINLKVVDKASKWIAQGVSDDALLYDNKYGGSSVFDPLRIDGDAFLLMVELKLQLFLGDNMVTIVLGDEILVEHYSDDKCAAVRKVIVRAAVLLNTNKKATSRGINISEAPGNFKRPKVPPTAPPKVKR